ncbi:hypothetical protein SAMN05444148_2279 [Winogradskyella jejuensis]|uniref:Uncharacterized protein n=1 Tax=Winogradskyella jejuensis TaxID=1089305 RepID=A0A1M5TVD9_9FLAO|nr:hypothetical protein SAMN05444148_2279 [Winogradskyella jejuensis]
MWTIHIKTLPAAISMMTFETNSIKQKTSLIGWFFYVNVLQFYLTNFLYLIRFGIKSPPRRFFLFSSYSEKPPSKK